MNYPCLYCIYNTKRCKDAEKAQKDSYCRWLSYYLSEEEQTGE